MPYGLPYDDESLAGAACEAELRDEIATELGCTPILEMDVRHLELDPTFWQRTDRTEDIMLRRSRKREHALETARLAQEKAIYEKQRVVERLHWHRQWWELAEAGRAASHMKYAELYRLGCAVAEAAAAQWRAAQWGAELDRRDAARRAAFDWKRFCGAFAGIADACEWLSRLQTDAFLPKGAELVPFRMEPDFLEARERVRDAIACAGATTLLTRGTKYLWAFGAWVSGVPQARSGVVKAGSLAEAILCLVNRYQCPADHIYVVRPATPDERDWYQKYGASA